MSEWWTYRLHDFLMFSPRTYARMFELYNEAIWPINALAALIAFALLFITTRLAFPPAKRSASNAPALSNQALWRQALHLTVFAYFAAAHLWIALVFLREHYAPIFWAANYFAIAFIAQAALFAFAAAIAVLSRDAFYFARSQRVAVLSVITVSLALLVHPAVLLAIQNSWLALELVGIAPDTTAIAALGFLLLIRPSDAANGAARLARYLCRTMIAIAIAGCVIALLTRLAMQSFLAIAPALAILAWITSLFINRPSELGDAHK